MNEDPWEAAKHRDRYPWRSSIYSVPESVQEHHAYDEDKWVMNWTDPESWLPTYAELVHFTAGKRGFGALDKGSYPNLITRWEGIRTRFFARYCDRRINRETATLWQVKLQERYDSIAAQYDRAYTLYGQYGSAALTDVYDGSETEGDDEAETESKHIDTPNTKINANPEYADTLDKGKTKGKRKSKTKRSGNLLAKLNENIYSYKDIDTAFISEFENMFLNILG